MLITRDKLERAMICARWDMFDRKRTHEALEDATKESKHSAEWWRRKVHGRVLMGYTPAVVLHWIEARWHL